MDRIAKIHTITDSRGNWFVSGTSTFLPLPSIATAATAIIAIAATGLDVDSPEPYRAAAYRLLGERVATLVDGSAWWAEVMDTIG